MISTVVMYVLMLSGEWTVYHSPKITDLDTFWDHGNEVVMSQPQVRAFVCVDRGPEETTSMWRSERNVD